MPDDEVRDWSTYHEYSAFGERFAQSMGLGKSKMREQQERAGRSGPPGTSQTLAEKVGEAAEALGLDKFPSKEGHKGHSHSQGDVKQWAEDHEKRHPTSGLSQTDANTNANNEKAATAESDSNALASEPSQAALDSNFSGTGAASITRERTVTYSEPFPPANLHHSASAPTGASKLENKGSTKKRRRGTTKSSSRFRADSDDIMLERDDAEKLLSLVQGNLVVFPYDWLEKEEKDGGWLYAVDQIAPLEI